jgi:hypothetical protein
MVYRFMSENQDRYTVREMADLFGVSCRAYYLIWGIVFVPVFPDVFCDPVLIS